MAIPTKSFSYHLYLKQTLEKAIATDKIAEISLHTCCAIFYEKTSSFLGYPKWSEICCPDDKQTLSYEPNHQFYQPFKHAVQ